MKRARAIFIVAFILIAIIQSFNVELYEANFTTVNKRTILVPRDYQSIQDAIDASSPGDTIIVLPGVYNVSSTITVCTSNIILRGSGSSTILKAAPPLKGPIIAISEGKNITIANMTLDGNKAEISMENPWTPVFLLKNVRNATISDIRIINASGSGLYMTYPGSPSPKAVVRGIEVINATGVAVVVDGNAQDILIEDVKIIGGEARGLLVNTAGGIMRNIVLRRIYVYNTGGKIEEWYGSGTGIQFDGTYGGKGEDIIIQDAIVEKSGSFGIWIIGEAWRNVRLINCTVKNNRDADAFGLAGVKNVFLINCTSIGSHIDGFAFGSIGTPPIDKIIIYGCKAIESGLKTGGKGFMLYRVMNSLIVDSEALETGGAGFFCRGCINNTFIGIKSQRAGLREGSEGGITFLSDMEPNQTGSINNTVMYSIFSDSQCGISLDIYPSVAHSYNNKFHHNNFIGNMMPVCTGSSASNIWDNGYPSGGNYWSNYNALDVRSGPNQDVSGSDGIGDHPYTINSANRDRYPLIKPVDPQAIAKAIADLKILPREYFMVHLGNFAGKAIMYRKAVDGKIVEVLVDYRSVMEYERTNYCGLDNLPPAYSIEEQVKQWRAGYSKNRMYYSLDGCWYWVYFRATYNP